MKSIHKIIGFIILIAVFSSFALSQQQNEDDLIIGTWVEETTTIANRWVFSENGILQEYYQNQLDATYTWQITQSQTPSGLTISYLILTNTILMTFINMKLTE